jgi:hypothetical protein
MANFYLILDSLSKYSPYSFISDEASKDLDHLFWSMAGLVLDIFTPPSWILGLFVLDIRYHVSLMFSMDEANRNDNDVCLNTNITFWRQTLSDRSYSQCWHVLVLFH